MSRFQHFILTRFNMRLSGPGADSHPERLNPGWLARRLKLFKAFCLPSVMAQTERRFRWLVFLDPETPPYFRRMANDLAAQGGFEAVYEGECVAGVLQSAVASRLDQAKTHLITTRLDNDDALATDYIERVQQGFSGQDAEFLHFPCGYVLSGGRAYLRSFVSGPFMSFVERMTAFRTVYCGTHESLLGVAPIREMAGPPAWIQVIHRDNISNRVHGVRQPLSRILGSGRFALPVVLSLENEGMAAFWIQRTRGGASEALTWAWQRVRRFFQRRCAAAGARARS